MKSRNLLLIAAMAACSGCPQSGGSGLQGHLIYEGQNNASPPGFDIWNATLENGAATGAPVNLTNTAGDDMEADWNQTEHKIAFASDRAGNFDLYVMDADGSNVVQVTSDSHMQRLPSWDPSGNEIAFATDEDGDFEIFVVRPNGNNPRQLTHNDCVDSDPAWSPNGQSIAYVTNCDSTSDLEIHVMSFDGVDDVRLTTRPNTDDFHPSWSPDSTKLAFESVPTGGSAHVNTEIVTMSADGSNQQPLVFSGNLHDFAHPAWSPGGDRIAIARIDATGDYNLFLVDPTGGTPTLAVDQPLTQWAPAWGDPAP